MEIQSEALDKLIEQGRKLQSFHGNMLHPHITELSREVADLLSNLDAEELVTLYLQELPKYRDGELPFAYIQGIRFAMNRLKAISVNESGLVVLGIAYFKEKHRAFPPSKEYPVGEDAPIQKLKDMIFLFQKSNVHVDIVYMNDAIGEKRESDNHSEHTPSIYMLRYLMFILDNPELVGDVELVDRQGKTLSMEFMSYPLETIAEIRLFGGNLRIVFTSLEDYVQEREDHRERFENRNSAGKITERKGGGVIANLERSLGDFRDDRIPAERTVRIVSDADRAFPEAGWAGEAVHSILEEGKLAYLADLKSEHTIHVSDPTPATSEDAQTMAKFKRRKLFLSGFLIPLFFPELRNVHEYKGTTQLPAKAFSGVINFADAQLRTVQPNVDLGLISVVLRHANDHGGQIGSGPLVAVDNLESSVMTTVDTQDEWEKTYGPIFRSVPELIIKDEMKEQYAWLVEFLEDMGHGHYSKLFTDLEDPNILAMFDLIESRQKSGYDDETIARIKQYLDSIEF